MTSSKVASSFGVVSRSIIELRLWVLSRASLMSPSVNSDPLFLGFPDFKCTSVGEVSESS